MPLILASGSPRRRELLENAAVPLASVRSPDILEQRNRDESPLEYCCRLAREKSHAISEPGLWVLAADTIVLRDEQVFEKPRDASDALRMLTVLAEAPHQVISAWCLRNCDDNHIIEGHSISTVRFRDVRTNELRAYVASGECFDKAGAYGIQGLGAVLIDEIEGSYSNIVGLPLQPVLDALRTIGLIT